MRWVRAAALIVVGLLLLLGGGAEVTRPASDPAPHERYPIEYLDRTEAKYAELHQQLQQYIVCEETGRWDQWPCTQWTPDGRAK